MAKKIRYTKKQQRLGYFELIDALSENIEIIVQTRLTPYKKASILAKAQKIKEYSNKLKNELYGNH